MVREAKYRALRALANFFWALSPKPQQALRALVAGLPPKADAERIRFTVTVQFIGHPRLHSLGQTNQTWGNVNWCLSGAFAFLRIVESTKFASTRQALTVAREAVPRLADLAICKLDLFPRFFV